MIIAMTPVDLKILAIMLSHRVVMILIVVGAQVTAGILDQLIGILIGKCLKNN